MKKEKADLVQAWLLKAQKDLFSAQQALTWGDEYADVACFHAQQAAEKSLKAYLVRLEIEFPKTPVLDDLLDLIARKTSTLEDWREALQDLTPVAVETRYPEFSLPSPEEAKTATETAEGVLNAVKSFLGDESTA